MIAVRAQSDPGQTGRGAVQNADTKFQRGRGCCRRNIAHPATITDEGLADAGAADPFRFPRLHPGIEFAVSPPVSLRTETLTQRGVWWPGPSGWPTLGGMTTPSASGGNRLP